MYSIIWFLIQPNANRSAVFHCLPIDELLPRWSCWPNRNHHCKWFLEDQEVIVHQRKTKMKSWYHSIITTAMYQWDSNYNGKEKSHNLNDFVTKNNCTSRLTCTAPFVDCSILIKPEKKVELSNIWIVSSGSMISVQMLQKNMFSYVCFDCDTDNEWTSYILLSFHSNLTEWSRFL